MRRFLVPLCCLVILSGPARCQSPAEKEATINFLLRLQDKDGGYRNTPGEKTSLRATSSAINALHYFGDEAPAMKTGVYLKSCWDEKEGGFAEHPDCPAHVHATAVGVIAWMRVVNKKDQYVAPAVKYLAANAKSFEEIRIAAAALEAVHERPKVADDWIRTVEKLRNPDGTFGKGDGVARETGGATACLLRLGAKVEDPAAVVKVLDAGQRKDGGFGKEGAAASDLESTYRVVRCYHMLKARPAEGQKCREFIARCRNADGGYGVAPGQGSTVAGTYFAGILLHWLQEK
jgi:prenyltransferase beta subunit